MRGIEIKDGRFHADHAAQLRLGLRSAKVLDKVGQVGKSAQRQPCHGLPAAIRNRGESSPLVGREVRINGKSLRRVRPIGGTGEGKASERNAQDKSTYDVREHRTPPRPNSLRPNSPKPTLILTLAPVSATNTCVTKKAKLHSRVQGPADWSISGVRKKSVRRSHSPQPSIRTGQA